MNTTTHTCSHQPNEIDDLIRCYDISLAGDEHGFTEPMLFIRNTRLAKKGDNLAKIKQAKPQIIAELQRRKEHGYARVMLDKTIEGVQEIVDISGRLSDYNARLRAYCAGDGVTPPCPPKPSVSMDDLTEARRKYPLATTYLEAEKLASSANLELASIGDKAIDMIADGCTAEAASTYMTEERNKFNERHMWD